MSAWAIFLKKHLVFVLILISPSFLFADEKENQDNFTLSPEEEFLFTEIETVISAAKYEQKISEAPSTIYVITAEDIRLSGLTSIPEILRTIPGLDVIMVSASQGEVNARGFTEIPSNKMLVMIDGRSIYNNTYNFVIWNALPIVLEEIKQIEVILGPGSTLYGANAFSGVIHILTKHPDEAKGTRFTSTIGNQSFYHQSFLAANTSDNLGWKISAGWDKIDQWRTNEKSGDVVKCNGELQYKLARDCFTRLTFGYSGSNNEILASPDTGFVNFEIDSYYFSHLFQIKGLTTQVYYENADSRFEQLAVNFFEIAEAPIDNGTADFQVQYTFDPFVWCKLTAGGNYRFNGIKWQYLDKKERLLEEGSGFIQGVFTPLKEISVTAGGRYDHYPLLDRWSYRGSIIYNFIKRHLLRFSYGNAFRNPSYTESYIDNTVYLKLMPSISIHHMGNKGLKPEAMETYELTYQGLSYDNRLKAQLTIFYNEINDSIELVTCDWVGLLPQKATFKNALDRRTIGGEFSLRFQWTKAVSSFVNYSFQDIRYTKDDPLNRIFFAPSYDNQHTVKKGNRVTSWPLHKVSTGLRFLMANGFAADLVGHYIGKTYKWPPFSEGLTSQWLNDYILVNARVSYRFWDKRAELAVSGSNLLFDTHQEVLPYGERIETRVLFSLLINL